jgi:methanogenic corrinoid protein MtbC1
MDTDNVYDELKSAILQYDQERARTIAARILDEGLDPLQALDAMTDAIRMVGEGFEREELWLPDLVGAADVMLAAAPPLEEEIRRRSLKRASSGVIVVGTVYGDIHSIGKTMVCTLLTADGFEVHDIGINIKAEEFVEAVSEYGPDILAMSALMTMTAPEQIKVIDYLHERGLRERVKVMVGGGAITADFAESIGADGYDPTAPGAVAVARRLIGMEAGTGERK